MKIDIQGSIVSFTQHLQISCSQTRVEIPQLVLVDETLRHCFHLHLRTFVAANAGGHAGQKPFDICLAPKCHGVCIECMVIRIKEDLLESSNQYGQAMIKASKLQSVKHCSTSSLQTI